MVNLNGIIRRQYVFYARILCLSLFLLPFGTSFSGTGPGPGVPQQQVQSDPASSSDTLFYAVKTGNIEMVRNLIDSGTNLNAIDDKGWTSLDYAIKRNRPMIRELLEESGAVTYPKSIRSMNDGPHVRIIDDKTVEVLYLSHDGPSATSEIKSNIYQVGDRPLLINGIKIDREDLNQGSRITAQVMSYQGARKIFVIGDIHGEYTRVFNLLKNAEIINDKGDWIWGKGNLVFMGDIFDRGSGVTETLWMIFRLEKQAEAAGGKVHLLLGNHEPMIFGDDIRYVNDDYYALCKNLGLDYSELFDEATVLGSWLRQKPLVISINNYLFVHGGLSPVLIESQLPLDTINSVVWRYLNEKENEGDKNLKDLILGGEGVLWYRGLVNDDDRREVIDEITLEKGLDFYQARAIIIGHTEVDSITSFYNGKVIDVNIPKRDPEIPEQGLLIKKGKLWVLYDTGDRKKL